MHNPGLKKENSNSEKLKLIKLGPFQPKINFPKNEEIQSQTSKYQLWFIKNEYPYLEYNVEKGLAHCFACSLFPTE